MPNFNFLRFNKNYFALSRNGPDVVDRDKAIEPGDDTTYIHQSRVLLNTTTRKLAFFGVACLIIAMAAFGVYIFPLTKVGAANNTPARLCGNSSDEAAALGCTWDQLTWSWYPPTCPHYANQEFLAAERWKFYTDPLGKNEAVGESWVNALDNKQDLWGERREHRTHCVYMFLSLGQIIRDKTPFPPKLVEYEHLKHCADLILEALKKDKEWTSIDTKVGKASYDQHC